ncbi:MAG TPA: PHP-associated domain-containing protein [Bacillota bacterium]|nr:PHP-associated domain-containing protein [Bacillota bacterium]
MSKIKNVIKRETHKYLYDTHVHASHASACAVNTGAEMVRAYANKGYSGLIMTDHFFNGNTSIRDDLGWEDRVNRFLKGYEDALAEGNKLGFSVFLGWEYADEGMEFLTYGLGKDFLLKHPDMLTWNIEKYLDIARTSGGFISQAHPFREASYIDRIRLFPDYVDAVEVINSSHEDPNFDRKALRYAKENSLIMTSGSDSHRIDDQMTGGMAFEYKLDTIHDFIGATRSGNYSLLG